MDKKAFRQFSYGLYLVTATNAKGRHMGCVINTAEQVTSNPYRVLFTLNKDNATCEAVQQSGRLAITILNQKANMDLIGTFGFKTSTEVNKFINFDMRRIDGLPWVADAAASVLVCKVESMVDAGTHKVFIAEVEDAEVVDAETPLLTYDYYHTVLKGTTPPKASSFVDELPSAADAQPADAQPATEAEPAAEKPVLHHFRCMLCGYVHETTDEELPATFSCPRCGVPRDCFQKID